MRLVEWIRDFFHRPLRVLWVCLSAAFVVVVVEGSLLQLWGLHRNYQRVAERIERLRSESDKLEFRGKQANRPEFVERRARDQFDLVNKGEIVFVFSD